MGEDIPNQEVETLKQKLNIANSDLHKAQQELTSTKAELGSISLDVGTMKADLEKSQSELSSTKAELGNVKNELDIIEKMGVGAIDTFADWLDWIYYRINSAISVFSK